MMAMIFGTACGDKNDSNYEPVTPTAENGI